MKTLLFGIGLLFALPCVGQSTAVCNMTAAGDIADPAPRPIIERAAVPDRQGAPVADNQILELPGWERLEQILRAHEGQRRGRWIYDGTRDESLYFENGHIA